MLTFRKTSVSIGQGKAADEIRPHVMTGEKRIRSILRNMTAFLNPDVLAVRGYTGRLQKHNRRRTAEPRGSLNLPAFDLLRRGFGPCEEKRL